MVLYATIARKGQGPLPFACLESGRVERGEGRKKKGVVNECGDGVGGGYVHGVGEEKVIDGFA